jgi:prolyl 4-hydroxylase
MRRSLDDSWKNWLDENIGRGCNSQELLDILLQHEFTLDQIKTAMGPAFPTQPDHRALCRVRLTDPGREPGAERFPSDKIQLYSIESFLSPEECSAIIAEMDKSLRPSTLTVEKPGDKYFRTSSTSDLSLLPSDIVSAIDEKIALTLGISASYSEGIQAQRYEVGQQFKHHTDYFEPGTAEYKEFARQRGNRTWTFMIYLNDVEAGGGTHFSALDHIFPPRRGTALAWNNLDADGRPNINTMHAGLAVERGRKDIITKWFRERGTGPMF